jgi:membrane-associated phospholipid phosphatase
MEAFWLRDRELTHKVQTLQLPLVLELIIAPGAFVFGYPFGLLTNFTMAMFGGMGIFYLTFSSGLIAALPSTILKSIFKRERPPRLEKHFHKLPLRHYRIFNLSTKDNGSFPSSDTTAASAVLFTLALRGYMDIWVAVLITLQVALGRLDFGFHHVADVAVGSVLGFVASVAMVFFIDEYTWIITLIAYCSFWMLHHNLVDKKKLYEEYSAQEPLVVNVALVHQPSTSLKAEEEEGSQVITALK